MGSPLPVNVSAGVQKRMPVGAVYRAVPVVPPQESLAVVLPGESVLPPNRAVQPSPLVNIQLTLERFVLGF